MKKLIHHIRSHVNLLVFIFWRLCVVIAKNRGHAISDGER